jgi:hypothetical protein
MFNLLCIPLTEEARFRLRSLALVITPFSAVRSQRQQPVLHSSLVHCGYAVTALPFTAGSHGERRRPVQAERIDVLVILFSQMSAGASFSRRVACTPAFQQGLMAARVWSSSAVHTSVRSV